MNKYTKEQLIEHVKGLLLERGVTMQSMAIIVYDLQKKYILDVTLEDCFFHLEKVLEKREVQNAIMTGIMIDKMAEQGLVDGPLEDMLKIDDSLYGIDEILPLSIVNIYGTIGLTNFGYLDKVKPGIIGELNDHSSGKINVFLDDIVCALVASVCSRIAHSSIEGKIHRNQ